MKKTSARKSLLMSILAMLFSISMFAGTTFAWFTDSVTSSNNKIVAGNLDVELTHTNANVTEAESVENKSNLFRDADGNEMKWEPGAVSYETFTISNEGTLAFKYKMNMNVTGNNKVTATNVTLLTALKVKVLGDTQENPILSSVTRESVAGLDWTSSQTLGAFEAEGQLYPEGTEGDYTSEKTFQVIVYWEPGTNDNQWNVKPSETSDGTALWINFGVSVVATQLEHEADSFNNEYDKDAHLYKITSTGAWVDGDYTLEKTDNVYAMISDGITPGTVVALTSNGTHTLGTAQIEVSDSGITYKNNGTAQNVIIRTNGGTLTINAPADTVRHYGDADSVNIIAVASNSYHENGTVPFIQISRGRVEIEANGDVNGIHVANVQNVAEDGTITKTENKFSNDVVLTLNGNEVKLTRDTIGTDIENPVLVCEVQKNANSNEFIWLVGDGTIENAKVYVTETNTTPNTAVASTTTAENASAAAIAIANNATKTGTEEDPIYVAVEAGTSADDAQVASALKGSGTEADPFLVYDYATMQKISDFYDKGYYYFAVDMSKTDNGKIDCSGWVPVYLHGSFDGNGVKFTNVTACLFQTVGYQLQNENILLEDFDATMNVSSNGNYGAAALIKNIFNSGITTFDNVKVHGYLEGFWNMGSFYNYGTTNYDDVGSDYEVVFNNCYSDATLVCSSGNTIGGLFGHAYEGSGHSFTLRVNNTEYVGQMFLTTASGKGNKYFGMTSDYYNANNHFYFNGVEDTFDNGSAKNAGAYTNSTKIKNVTAVKGSNGYTIEKQANVSKIVVTITAQLTAYDANGVKISNLSGITMTLSSTELTELDGSNIKVLDLFNSIDITKNASEYGAGVSNNTLNIRLSSSANYQSGNIRLQVNQYDSTGSIVSAGTVDLATSTNANSGWTVK